jgi:hypothetical protein
MKTDATRAQRKKTHCCLVLKPLRFRNVRLRAYHLRVLHQVWLRYQGFAPQQAAHLREWCRKHRQSRVQGSFHVFG